LTDLNLLPIHVKNGIYIHRGFYNQFLSVERVISFELMKYPGEMILKISGHSIGSALAQIASAYYGEMFPAKKVICYTTGSPRTGNKQFVKWFSDNVKRHYRIVNKEDPVMMIPNELIWKHTMNTCIVIDENCNVSLTVKDIPWWSRLISPLTQLDLEWRINYHSLDEYIIRLTKLQKKVTEKTVNIISSKEDS
jgi:hypothetical protein